MATINLNTREGHDWGHPNTDRLGIFFISFACIWTAIVFGGLFAIFTVRNTHAVRIRSFSVICATVLTLHVYLVLILIAYPLNGLYKCGYEFWVMNILLPLGIALFQASNMRLFSYASDQKEISQGKLNPKLKYKLNIMRPCPIEWAKHHSIERRTYGLICIGGALQLVVALFIYLGSRKFHADYGLFSKSVDPASCRRGTEWVPSVVWQFIWATVFGPYVLLRIRDINDTHYWAWQTRFSIVACLPGTPLWLTFIYTNDPHLVKINEWFVPSGWFLPGLIMMQFVSIFSPLLDVYNLKAIERKFGNNRLEQPLYGPGENKTNPYSMATLEMQLAKNPSSLLYWAYTKEFTAENILFLTSVRDFKRKWEQVAKRTNLLTAVQQRERYEEAAVIFFRLVNPETARMNINIDSHTFRELEKMFKTCHYEPVDDCSSISKISNGIVNVVAPWDEFERPPSCVSHQSDEGKLLHDVDKLYPLPVTEIRAKSDSTHATEPDEDVAIPATFSLETFDRAYEIVKNDVYLNTWVRYEARYSRPRSRPAGFRSRAQSIPLVTRV